MAVELVRVTDTRTGVELRDPVPVTWLRIFPHLHRTPDQVEVDADSAPARNAGTAEWIEYGVTRGLPRDEAEEMTRGDLIAELTQKES